jgi:hypothetical protein
MATSGGRKRDATAATRFVATLSGPDGGAKRQGIGFERSGRIGDKPDMDVMKGMGR